MRLKKISRLAVATAMVSAMVFPMTASAETFAETVEFHESGSDTVGFHESGSDTAEFHESGSDTVGFHESGSDTAEFHESDSDKAEFHDVGFHYDGKNGSWHKNSKGWWFEDAEGRYPTNSWQKIKGKWYYFDSVGYMEADSYRNGYYLTETGEWDGKAAVPGWRKDKNGWWWYSLGKGSYLKNTWEKIDGKWYYFQEEGYMEEEAFVDGYWLGKNGAMTNFARCSWHKTAKGSWYGNAGWYATTTYIIDGVACNFDEAGYQIFK